MEEIFGKNGLIAKHHKEYEYRAGQIKMAEAVLRAFEEKKHLIVEAGTGTGKTMAYLVPAIAAALGQKKRVIISTGTKNLQEQLMEKDIPFLQKVMPKKFTAACDERSLELRLSVSRRKGGKSADSRRFGRNGSFRRSAPLVARIGNRRPRRAVEFARKYFVLAQNQRQKRNLSRSKMSRFRAVFYHANARSEPTTPTSSSSIIIFFSPI